jgi:hypothetical protein
LRGGGFNGTNIKDSVMGKTIAVPALANFVVDLQLGCASRFEYGVASVANLARLR